MDQLPQQPPLPPVNHRPSWMERWGLVPAVVVFFLSLAATFVLWRYITQILQGDYWHDLVIDSGAITTEINNRLKLYQGVLRGTRGFFVGSQLVERGEWRQFVTALELESIPASVSALAYVAVVPEASREAFIKSIREDTTDPTAPAEKISMFDISPSGVRDEYYLPIFIEPFSEENKQVFGTDLRSNPERRRGFEQARDTGTTTVTQRIHSLTTGEPAFSLYIPVYHGSFPTTVEERRIALTGFILVIFETKKFFRAVGQTGQTRPIHFLVYDNPTDASAQTLLFSSHPDITAPDLIPNTFFRYETTVPLLQTGWKVVYFQEPPGRPQQLKDYAPGLILLAGTTFSIMLFVLVGSLSTTGMGAVQQERKTAKRLQTSEAQYANVIGSTQDLIFHTDLDGKILLISPSAEQLLHIPPGSLINQPAQQLFADPDEFVSLLAALQRGETVWGRKISLSFPAEKPLTLSASAYLLGKTAGNLSEIEWVLRDNTTKTN